MIEYAVEPLAAKVYRLISEDIITGRLVPGTPLIQKQLAVRFEVSRTPIRDVLTQLIADGLAQLISGKGCFVSDMSRDAVIDVYAVRSALEEPAFRIAFGRHTPLQLHELRILASETLLIDPENGAEFYDASLHFHRLLMAPCPNQYLLEVLFDVWNHPVQRRITLTHRPSPEHTRHVAAGHSAIVNALESGDLESGLQALSNCHAPISHRRSTPEA